MSCARRTLLLSAGLLAACGPTVQENAPGSGSGSSDEGEDGSSEESGPAALDCSATATNAIQARVITGRGTPTIEVLGEGIGGDLVPFACADEVPSCHYDLSLLVPIGALVPATFTAADGSLRHLVESCDCCNGEDGGSDEIYGTVEHEDTTLVIEAVSEACVTGWYEDRGTRIDFVAEVCGW